MKLKNRVAIVTGSTQNIGKGIVKLFAEEGAKVVIVGRNVKGGLAVKDEIRKNGGDALFIQSDVTKVDEVRSLVSETLKTYKKIDVLVNNVGGDEFGKVSDHTIQQWHRVMDISLNSAFYILSRNYRNSKSKFFALFIEFNYSESRKQGKLRRSEHTDSPYRK